MDNKKALDEKWFSRFLEIGMFDDIEYFGGDGAYRLKQKELFLKDEIEYPTLDYPKLDGFDFPGREDVLNKLADDIDKEEKNEAVRELYSRKIEEKLLVLELLKATKEKDDEGFLDLSRNIYGDMDKGLFIRSAKKIMDVSELYRKNTSEQGELYDYIKKMLKKFPEPEHIEGLDDLPVFLYGNDKKEFNASSIKRIFESELEKVGLSDWKVLIGEPGQYPAININQNTKEVRIPFERMAGKRELSGLVEHEIGVHLMRRKNGENSPLRLLGVGLDKSLGAEEGLASCIEQKIIKGNHQLGVGYFTIGLILGLDGKKRSFKEVFNIFSLVSNAMIVEKDDKKRKAAAEDYAWRYLVRVFRGTTRKTKGICFIRNKVYIEGNIATWKILNKDSDFLPKMYLGRFDATNEVHVRCLKELGIL